MNGRSFIFARFALFASTVLFVGVSPFSALPIYAEDIGSSFFMESGQSKSNDAEACAPIVNGSSDSNSSINNDESAPFIEEEREDLPVAADSQSSSSAQAVNPQTPVEESSDATSANSVVNAADQVKSEQSIETNADTDGDAAPEIELELSVAQGEKAAAPSVSVEAHIQNLGWQKPVAMGEVAGTVGKNLNLEALRLSPEGFPVESSLSLQVHVANLGWIDAVGAGQVAGTVGKNLPIEAIRLSISGEIANQFNIWYRVHSADFGWSGWAKNGESAGSQGYAKSAQAVQIQLLPKDSDAPGLTSQAFRVFDIAYQAHVATIGWQGRVTDGAIAGTTGLNLGLEALNVSLGGAVPSGGVQVRAHVSNVGWQAWTSGTAGTTGRGLAIEALQMRLTGSAADTYDIWYRVHTTNIGWLDWAANGSPAGTTGKAYSVQAVQIKLMPKGQQAPGKTTTSYVGAYETLSLTGTSINGSVSTSDRAISVVVGDCNSSLALQSFSAHVDNKITEGSVAYRTFLAYRGWSDDWTAEGTPVYVGNDGLSLSAVEVKLSGPLSDTYDLWYRVSVVGKGWLEWASNGASAGVNGNCDGVNAIQLDLRKKGSAAPGSTANAFIQPESSSLCVSYQAHSSNIGWMPKTANGETAGTTGRGLALEALRVAVENAPVSGGVQVAAHVAEEGWQDYAAAPGYAGTTGKNRAVQAVRIKLTGDLASTYDVYYRMHCSEYGWLGWACNGETAGTTGLALQAEAVQIKLIKKGADGPSSTEPAYVCVPTLSMQTHVQDLGWTGVAANGGISGTTGRGLKVEGLKLAVDSDIPGGISYRAHVQDFGWQKTVADGSLAGTTGQNKRIEALQISLSGTLSKFFDVWYRVHVEGYGWLGWTRNGATAGTTKIGYRVEALQVKIVAKGAAAPGTTTMAYTEKPLIPADQAAMMNRIVGVSSSTRYLLAVDTSTCRTGVFTGSRGNWTLLYYWQCGPGKPSTPTVKGEFTVQAKGYVFGHGYSCYYYTQFLGDYLFHSIKYNPGTFNVQDGRLGVQVSEGCVRLALENAKWIYDNIPRGTKVVIW